MSPGLEQEKTEITEKGWPRFPLSTAAGERAGVRGQVSRHARIRPLRLPPGLLWLRQELAPFPGRDAMTLRLVLGVVAVTIISMALRTPFTAISAYMVFFVTKQNRVVTTKTGILGVT